MKKILTVALSLLVLGACTKFQRGKWAYNHGNFQKAVSILEEAVKIGQDNPDVQKYLVVARAGLWTDQAAKAMASGDYNNALSRLDAALGLDPKNADAQTLLNGCITKIKETIQGDFIPGKRWDKVIAFTGLILKYRPDEPGLAPLNAEALFHNENDALNWRTIPAIEKAFAQAPDNGFLKEKSEVLAAKTQTFRDLFARYQSSLANKDYQGWGRLVSARNVSEANVDIKRLAENGDTEVKNLQDYFRVIALDPAKYGSPDGPRIVCVEPLSESHAFVHFKYATLPKVLKMEIVSEGGALKLHREEDSAIPVEGL